MVNLLLKAGDRLAARFIPTARASAGCTPQNYYWGCYCAGNGAIEDRYCNHTLVYGNCAGTTLYDVYVGRCS